MTRELRGSYVWIRGGGHPSRHRPTARKAPKGPADQPRTKVFWGGVIEANWHWSDPQPTPKPPWQGVWFNDYVAVAVVQTRLRYSLYARGFGR